MDYFPVIDLSATGANIQQLRQARGLTVNDLQQYFGFEQPQAIYKWQKGLCLPKVDHLYALGQLLCVPMEDILVPQQVALAASSGATNGASSNASNSVNTCVCRSVNSSITKKDEAVSQGGKIASSFWFCLIRGMSGKHRYRSPHLKNTTPPLTLVALWAFLRYPVSS